MAVRTIPIQDLKVDLSIQPRVGGLDLEHVRVLKECPDVWPPLLVAERDGGFVLVDGFHRFKAAMELGLGEVPVEANVPPGADLLEVAFQANDHHGRSLSLRDRRRHAEHLMRRDPLVSNAAIGGASTLSPSTVQAIRERLEADAEIDVTTYAPTSRARVPVPRQSGTLPETGLLEDLNDGIRRFFEPPRLTEQRRAARYLERLSVALDDLPAALAAIETPEEAAQACIAVLGEDKSEQVAAALGSGSISLTQIAHALGYVGTAQA